MTRKRCVKLMRAAMAQCHEVNKRSSTGSPAKMGTVYRATRDFELSEGKSYAEVWEFVNNNLRGIISVCR